uniref:Putative mRNA interferase YoeB n=1 Tax=Candidatus Kentrum sp. FW TaxID=2126338 RepID=A0A450S441_9GAMM|nr:MAG: toxin YoeB [Candidatus Kentron sp. FW]VFJ46573.1 MAG: toxin YoeB [Candidatus Kentron sp. FW]
MKVAFEQCAFDDFTQWAATDKKIHKRIVSLITDTLRRPYVGIGKPEPLRHELRGYWSRRITDEHRLVYKVEGDMLVIIACRYHYHLDKARGG